MEVGEGSPAPSLGFLSVVECPAAGLVGGYLILNLAGRPLEFHCTAPVKPTRSQEILYGPTLKPYLYGEQIGFTLLTKPKHRPTAVLTDCPAALAVRDFVPLPVALLQDAPAVAGPVDPAGATSGASQWRVDSAHAAVGGPHDFTLGVFRFSVPTSYPRDSQALAEQLAPLAERFDFREPFERIRAAIEEAQRSGR